jgi:hypothetical protein
VRVPVLLRNTQRWPLQQVLGKICWGGLCVSVINITVVNSNSTLTARYFLLPTPYMFDRNTVDLRSIFCYGPFSAVRHLRQLLFGNCSSAKALYWKYLLGKRSGYILFYLHSLTNFNMDNASSPRNDSTGTRSTSGLSRIRGRVKVMAEAMPLVL